MWLGWLWRLVCGDVTGIICRISNQAVVTSGDLREDLE
jgi:hypothetical protein